MIFFLVIIAGLVLNTIFLVREIRRNEQHDSFINAVTHELKTPVASIRLYLQTLQTRDLDEAKRREFYRIMWRTATAAAHDRTGAAGRGARSQDCPRITGSGPNLAEVARECVALARTRFHLGSRRARFRARRHRTEPIVLGDGRRAEGGRLESDRQRGQVLSWRSPCPGWRIQEVENQRFAVRVSN